MLSALGSACGAVNASEDVDLPTALQRTEALAAFLLPVIEEVDWRTEQSSLDGVDALCDALGAVLGPAATVTDEELVVVDGAVMYEPGQCNGLGDAANEDGRSALVIGSLTPVFFYEYTIIDTSMGRVYQSCRGVNSGCDTELLQFYGPLVPPDDALLIGAFDEQERLVLQDAVQQALR